MEILPKKSTVEGFAPPTESIVAGEIAINIYKGTEGLYTKNSAGEVIKIAGSDIYTLIGTYDPESKTGTGVYKALLDNEEVISKALARLNERVQYLEEAIKMLKKRLENLEGNGKI